MRRLAFLVVPLIALLLLAPRLPARVASGRSLDHTWVAAWAAAPQGPFPVGYAHAESLRVLRKVFPAYAADDQTLRLIVHSAASGDRVRIRLSNLFGGRPLVVGAAYAGLQADGAAVVPGSNRRLTFDKRAAVVIPAGGEVYSDPVPLIVAAQQNLAVSLYLPSFAPSLTWHASAFTTSYSTPALRGDHAADESGAAFVYRTTSWFLLDGVDVYSSDAGAVVVLGDSITDGWVSVDNRDDRWPDVLARRLLDLPPGRGLSVVDAGIAGNTIEPPLLPCPRCGRPAIARLNHDVLSQPGVRAVILFEGINDIGHGASAAYVIAGMRAIAARAHAHGLPIYAATILPDGGSAYMRPWLCRCDPLERERTRDEVNQFIRASHTFDGVLDFDAVLRDPSNPWRLAPWYDSGDHLHPNAAGLQAIGDAIPLGPLERDAALRGAAWRRPVATPVPARRPGAAPASPAAQ